MASSQTGSHASSKTPSAYIPREERVDLTMSKHAVREESTYTCAHLNYLECRGESVFADARCVNWLLNALRLHWKISGRVLRNLSDQAKDLCEFLNLEVEGKRIISDLFTDDAVHYLIDSVDPNGMMIFTAIVHEVYNTQWQSWCEEQINKHKQQGHHALVISQAQATANQLSNNILAFKDQAAPELRRWAETTVSGHLMAIVTPGHLPHRPAARNTARFASEDDATTPDAMNVKYMTTSSPRFSATPSHLPPRPTARDGAPFTSNQNFSDRHLMGVRCMGTSSRTSYAHDEYTRGQGQSNGRYQAPLPTHPSYLGEKRKITTSAPYYYESPYSKKARVKSESTSNYRSYETYRPSPSRHRAFDHGDNRSAQIDARRVTRIEPITTERATACEGPTIDSPTREKLLRAELDHLRNEIALQRSPTMSPSIPHVLNSSSSGSDDRKAPVINGPSYREFMRNNEDEAGKSVITDETSTTGHARVKSYVSADEGEVFE
ncbi:hypothetical protein E4T39_05007 [Aureobasidium subglaciale]|nr:hypothetical protein E4T39_05007 [Aureobasidium subglaciale]